MESFIFRWGHTQLVIYPVVVETVAWKRCKGQGSQNPRNVEKRLLNVRVVLLENNSLGPLLSLPLWWRAVITQMRELMRLEEEQEDDKQLALQIVAMARATAPRLAKMSSVAQHRNRWAAYQVRTFHVLLVYSYIAVYYSYIHIRIFRRTLNPSYSS